MLPVAAALAELEARGQALEADDCGDVFLAVLADGLHGGWDMVHDPGGSRAGPLCLHIVHDGDVGHVRVGGDERALRAGEGLRVRLGLQALLAESMATGH